MDINTKLGIARKALAAAKANGYTAGARDLMHQWAIDLADVDPQLAAELAAL